MCARACVHALRRAPRTLLFERAPSPLPRPVSPPALLPPSCHLPLSRFSTTPLDRLGRPTRTGLTVVDPLPRTPIHDESAELSRGPHLPPTAAGCYVRIRSSVVYHYVLTRLSVVMICCCNDMHHYNTQSWTLSKSSSLPSPLSSAAPAGGRRRTAPFGAGEVEGAA